MKNNLTKNYIFNLIYQTVSIVIPLIVTPYVSRVLTPSGIGTYSYLFSIVYYFVLLAVNGTSFYANREIGSVQNDVSKRSKKFWEILIARGFFTLISLICGAFVCCFINEDKTLFLILLINVVCVAVDVSWLFQGVENFGVVSIINTVLKIISVLLVFLLVKDKDDICLYALIMSLSTLIANISMWPWLVRYIKIFDKLNIKCHIKPILKLFIPIISASIYTTMNKTIIGWFASDSLENGYYEQADKIVKLCVTIVVTFGVAIIPRVAFCFKNKEFRELHELIYKDYEQLWILGIPMCIGLICISSQFVPFFFGAGYEKTIIILRFLSPIIILSGFNSITTDHFLVPIYKSGIVTIILAIGAIIGFIASMILVPEYYAVGAALASVITEFILVVVFVGYLKKNNLLNVKKIFMLALKPLIAGIVMLGFFALLNVFMSENIMNLFIEIIVSMCVYLLSLYILKERIVIECVNKLLKRA